MSSPDVLKVLVVEDEQLVSMLVEDMLLDLGYEVAAVASNLKAGIKAVEQAQPDLAVLDVNLNGEKSFPIADLLIRGGVPVVFASGYGLSGVRDVYPTVPVVQKPFTQIALANALERACSAVGKQVPEGPAQL
ncbi:MAG TPA: response regulator [Devosia sp.]|jgi:CheY-like chemotaxis protein|nr:response regulator [Devosia sp.]